MESEESTPIEIGRLLRAGNNEFVVGCQVSQYLRPEFGTLVTAPQGDDYRIYGLIHDIRIEDDGLVRQLVSAEISDESVIADNRLNRNVPMEMSVLCVGYLQDDRIYHLLPPRPPLSLDIIHLCGGDELRRFSEEGNFGYFRHILRAADIPQGELLAAHYKNAAGVHAAAGNQGWSEAAVQELIAILRDDPTALMSVMGALRDVMPAE